MFIWLWSLCCFAQAQLRCSHLLALHAKPSPLSKVYAPKLYALRSLTWEQMAQAGLQEDSSFEVGEDWLYWSSVSSLDFVSFVQPYLWPDAFVADLGEEVVLDTKEGRWIARKEGTGLLIMHGSAQREAFPEFWEPVENGCQVYMKSVHLPYLQAEPQDGVQLSFSHAEETVQIVFPREGDIPKFFAQQALGSWEPLQSAQKPTLALALGEEPISLLESGLFTLPEKFSLSQAQTLDKKLHIGSGTQVAVFQDDVFASIPLLGWFGCPLPRWQIEWGLRKGEKIGPHRRKIEQEGQTLFVEAHKGKVHIATSASLLDVLGEGEPWFSAPEPDEEERFLARINIPSSMHMFVGPLEYVELQVEAHPQTWSCTISSGTKSKAKPHQLFLTYFATLQQWEKKQDISVSQEIVVQLTKAAHQANFGYFPTEKEKQENTEFVIWNEQDRFFLEDLEGEIWTYDAINGITKYTEHVTNH